MQSFVVRGAILKFFEIFLYFNLLPPVRRKNQPQRAGRSQPIKQGKLEPKLPQLEPRYQLETGEVQFKFEPRTCTSAAPL